MKDLRTKVAFVAGGASGVGLGVVKALATAGMKVVVGCAKERSLARARRFANEHPGLPVLPMHVDLLDRHSVSWTVTEVQRLLGDVHVVCNCVHVRPGDEPREALADADRFLALNVSTVVNAVTAFLPTMKAHGKGGRFLNLASPSSFLAAAPCAPYVASMFALRAMTEALRLSVSRFGIGASLLCVPDGSWSQPPNFETELVSGLRSNRLYICAPASLLEPLQALHQEVRAAFPNTPPDARRAALEQRRREAGKRAATDLLNRAWA